MPVLNYPDRKKNNKDISGYTITEMIFVIFITGILASISVPSLINWKHFQTIKTRQLALRTTLEQIKSDAKRWGATCTISGSDLKSSCTSAVIQKTTTDTFGAQSTPEKVINPTVKDREAEKVFIGTNFKTITFSPRGFIHIDPIKSGSNNATFVWDFKMVAIRLKAKHQNLRRGSTPHWTYQRQTKEDEQINSERCCICNLRPRMLTITDR